MLRMGAGLLPELLVGELSTRGVVRGASNLGREDGADGAEGLLSRTGVWR